jgi:hypothetical protein
MSQEFAHSMAKSAVSAIADIPFSPIKLNFDEADDTDDASSQKKRHRTGKANAAKLDHRLMTPKKINFADKTNTPATPIKRDCSDKYAELRSFRTPRKALWHRYAVLIGSVEATTPAPPKINKGVKRTRSRKSSPIPFSLE